MANWPDQRVSRRGRWPLVALLATAAAAAIVLAAVILPAGGRARPADTTQTAASGMADPYVTQTPRGNIADPYVSGAFTKKYRQPYFLHRRGDDPAHVSYVIGALKVTPPTRMPVALIGGSNVRECLQRPADLRFALEAQTGVDTKVLLLGSANQHFGETMAVVDNLPKGPGVVVIAVNHTRFAYPPGQVAAQIQGTTLLMPSTALWRFILQTRGSAPANTIAPGVRAYWVEWRRRNAEILAAGGKPWNPYLPHRYPTSHYWSAAAKLRRAELWIANRGAPGAEFDRFIGFNAKLLAAIVRLAHERGHEVVLMEAPADLAIIGDAFDRYKAAYVPLCQEAAAAVGGSYIDVNASAGLLNSDFHDLTHLVGEGRTKWTKALAEALAPTVQRAASSSPNPSPSPSLSPQS